MANDLLENYRVASSHFNHVVFNKETRQFERAGKRHAIATFFGTADARSKNADTLKAIKEFMAIERVQEYGISSAEVSKDYFKSIKTSSRIDSAAINRIIAKMRDDMSVCPSAQNLAKEKILQSFLNDELNWYSFASCVSEGGDAKAVAGSMAKFLLDRCSGKMSIKNNAQFEEFRREADQKMRLSMNRLAVFLGHSRQDAEILGGLIEKFRAQGAEDGQGNKYLDRFMSALFAVVENGEGVFCDEVAVSRFLSLFEGEKMLERIKNGEYSGEEIGAAFNTASSHSSCAQTDCVVSAFELKLTAGELFDNFKNDNVLTGLADAFSDVRAEDVNDFLSVTSEIIKHNQDIQGSAENVQTCARAVNETLQFLRTQLDRHPSALMDGVQLMKDLQAPVSMETMKSLLGMAEKLVDGLQDVNRPVEESLDSNFALICFSGNAIASPVEKEMKNWIVTKFVLASAPKVRYQAFPGMLVSSGVVQDRAGRFLCTIASSLNAFYARADRPLCTKYAKALDFLVDQYFAANRFRKQIVDLPNASMISKELVEKYDMQKCTAANLGRYKTNVSDYKEFDGVKKVQADNAFQNISEIVRKARIFDGDKIRVKQLIMQEVAYLSKNGRFPDDKTVERISHYYCNVAKWAGGLLDRLVEVPVSDRRAVVMALESYNYSFDPVLFDMLTKDPVILKNLVEYVEECKKSYAQIDMDAMSVTSVNAWDIHVIITGNVGDRQALDPALNPHLATYYSHTYS